MIKVPPSRIQNDSSTLISLLVSLRKWFFHGLKIFGAGLGAYLLASIPFLIIEVVLKISPNNWLIGATFTLMGLVIIPLCVAGFGFLFTRLYTNTTWGHDAIQDMKVHEQSGYIKGRQ